MRALLLAAGHGTRLRPLTDTVPKCLVAIAGKPQLQHWLDALLAGGIERVLVNTHYLPEQVADFVASSRWRNRVDVVYERVLFGTAGTLKANREFFQGQAGLLAHADNLSKFDLADFIAHHARRPLAVALTMMTFEADDLRQCGIVAEDSRGVVTGFFEKVEALPGTRANGAVYIFEPLVLEFLESRPAGIIDFSTEVLPHYLGRMQTYFNGVYHRDIGTPESLATARQDCAAWTGPQSSG